jgi:dihydrofolate reductase
MRYTSSMSVFIIASLSADGFIAPSKLDPTTPSTSWTSPEDTQFFKIKTIEAGVVVMGHNTYNTIPSKYRPLQNRLNIVYSKQASRSDLTLLTRSDLKNINKPHYTQLPPHQLINLLLKQSFKNIAICGGTSIYTQFLEAGVVDELFLTIEPVIFGTGTPLFDKSISSKLHLVNTLTLSDQVKVLHYKIV